MSSLPEKPTSQLTRSLSLDALERISKISAQVTVVVGVVAALYGLHTSLESARRAEQAGKLQSLTQIQKFIEEDFNIQRRIANFNFGQLPDLEKKAVQESGRSLYFTDALGDLPTIGEHYELMGAELKLKYLMFDLVYEIVPFPDNFWERTRELRKNLRANFEGKGKPLPDLWSNFGYLCKQYRSRRRREDSKTADPKTLEGVRYDVAGCEK